MVKNSATKLRAKLFIALFFGALLAPAGVYAATLVSQTFAADSPLTAGTIVSLKSGTTDHVTSATVKNAGDIFGVVVNPDSSQLSISSGGADQVNVSQSGVESVLVSDINGSIESGDSITASPLSGVGMKATDNVKIVGIAQDKFPNSSSKKETYTDSKNQKQTVNIGQIPILVSVSYFYKQPDKTLVPQAIQNIANSLAGKKVNTLPILLSIAVFLITLIIVVSIIYSMIRSSIISVGRNPMSQAAVYRNVLQISALVVAILAVSIGAIYMILTKL
jgi:hypothetical protein